MISGWHENISQRSILNHLKITRISLGSNDKSTIIGKWCKEMNIGFDNVAYMGDDLNDIDVMKKVKLTACPNDAVDEIKKISTYVCEKNGGDGAVREFCDFILKIKTREQQKISCLIPCARVHIENINTRKFCNTTLLDLKLKTIKNIGFDEIIISSNDQNLRKYQNDQNIRFHNRNIDLCQNNVSYKSLYSDHFNVISNNILFHTTPISPFLTKKSIENFINIWKNNPQYELIIFGKKMKNLLSDDNRYMSLQQVGFMLDKETFEQYGNDVSKIKNIKYVEISDVESLVIKNNTKFVIAESLYYRNFISDKLINDYMLNSNFEKTKILDCTIRDSGYLNNWNWDYDTVRNFVYYMGEIGVEYCEIGFLKKSMYVEPGAGIWRNLGDHLEIIKKLKNDTDTKTKIAVMLDIHSSDEEYYDVNLLPNSSDTGIDLIRVFSFFSIIDRSVQVINILKKKGYTVSLNIGHCIHLDDSEIYYIKKIILNGTVHLDYLYFADSLGMMTADDTKKFISILKDIYPVKNGFHNHNNNGTVFSNIIELVNANIDIIDGTISGFGKNGGNANLEQILIFLFFKKKYNFNIEKLFEFLELIKNTNFSNDKITLINMPQIKKMLHQFMNVDASYFNKLKEKPIPDIYTCLKNLKNTKKIWK